MKVITEEDLIARRNKFIKQCKNIAACIVDELLYDCKELDTLTVSKLRPMSEAPRNGKFLVVLNTEDDFHECSFLSDGRIKIGTVAIRAEYCIGWTPKPIYKPEEPAEQMIWPDACG